MAVAVSPEMREKAAKVRKETIRMVASPAAARFNAYFISKYPSERRGEQSVKISLFTLCSLVFEISPYTGCR